MTGEPSLRGRRSAQHLPAPEAPRAERRVSRRRGQGPAELARLVPGPAAGDQEECDPWRQTGAVANACLLVALGSGVLLLLWYVPSVAQAHRSLEGGGLAGWVRSLHRYSSDACLCFVLLHAVKLLAQRRFDGPRWLPWTTGVLLLGLLWLIGWLGYWLVWDEGARQVALGSARLLDALPIFGDPLSRSLLVDERINPLLFVLVFFAHMLLPLALGLVLWLHLARTVRARFLTGRRLTLAILLALGLLSLAAPVTSAAPARMAVVPGELALDAWYLWPVALTDRLGAGTLWAVLLAGSAAALSLPWTLARRRARPAEVTLDRCSGCGNCYADCPFGAIAMLPRSDGRAPAFEARVDAARCLSCGICAGSCRSDAIGLPQFTAGDARRQLDELSDRHLALVCEHAAPARAQLDGYRTLRVPCAGWVGPVLLDHALRGGAAGVLIVACHPGACRYREGARWIEQRCAGQRQPGLPRRWRSAQQVRVLRSAPGELVRLEREAAAFRAGTSSPEPPRRIVPGILLGAALCGLVWAGSRVGYRPPPPRTATLVVSFKHPGRRVAVRAAANDDRPVHMRPRGPVAASRRRLPVRLRVHVDGRLVLDKSYPPRGLWGDGNSVALERLAVEPGRRRVEVELGDGPDPRRWDWRAERELDFTRGRQRVVLFDRVEGLRWH